MQSANEERGEDEGRQRRGSRGEASDEGELVAISPRADCLRTRGLALWVTESDSELNARSTLTLYWSMVIVLSTEEAEVYDHDNSRY